MAVLLLRMAGPMQSWGTQSRFTTRDTGLEPSKSGIIGLICAALGVKRNDIDTIREIAAVKMGVRVDRQGTIKKDFHTAGGWHKKEEEKYGVIKASGKDGGTVISNRFYLADAVFLIALKGDIDLLAKIQEGLQNPVWPLFLGRKSFVPGLPVWLQDGLKRDVDDLEAVLRNYPYLCSSCNGQERPEALRLEIETEYGLGDGVKNDQPQSFDINNRHYKPRYVDTTRIIRITELPLAEGMLCSFLA